MPANSLGRCSHERDAADRGDGLFVVLPCATPECREGTIMPMCFLVAPPARDRLFERRAWPLKGGGVAHFWEPRA